MFESLKTLRLRIRTLLDRRRLDQDLKDDLAFHLTMCEEQLRREGKSDPYASAHRQFGNVTHLQEKCREAWKFVSVRLQKHPKNAHAHRKMASLTPGIGYSMTAFLTSGISQRWKTAFVFVSKAVVS